MAVRDGDHIHGTLVGTALTTCGSAMGSLTTPNPVAQTEAIRRAYADAGLQPCEADFVELHGTGTKVCANHLLLYDTNVSDVLIFISRSVTVLRPMQQVRYSHVAEMACLSPSALSSPI